MGTGKSTLGRALTAYMPGWDYVDLDDLTESRLGMSASEAFATLGPDAFRQAEAEALESIAGRERLIVACGGGTPCFGRNMEIMLACGTVVRLWAGIDRLLRRLEEADGKRPLVAGLHGDALRRKVQLLMAEREPYYSRAHMDFDATYLENSTEIDLTCRRFIELLRYKQ